MIFKLALRSLFRQKSRSLAILLTIGFGLCALMVYHGFNAGIMNQYRDNTIHARYGHGAIYSKGYLDEVWEKPSDKWIDSNSELFSFLQSEKEKGEILNFFPRTLFSALINNGERNIAAVGLGVNGEAEHDFFDTMNVVEGKNLSTEEDGLLIGIGLARSLNLKIGDRVTILSNTVSNSLNAVDVYVTGIFFTGMKSFDDSSFRIQLNKSFELLDTNKVESIAIGLNRLSDWDNFSKKIIDSNKNLDVIPFNVLDKVYYQNSVDFLGAQFSFIFIIIFVIVILGIFNTVSTIILERRGEVGNLRANGDSALEVKILLVLESLILGFLGALLGVLLSYLITYTVLRNGIEMPPGPGITRQFTTFVELQTSFIPIAFFIGLISSGIGAYLASSKILKEKITHLLKGNL